MQTLKDKKHNKYQEMQRTENFQISIPNKSKKFLFIQTEMTKRVSQDVKEVKTALYNILESKLLKSYPTFKQCTLEILDTIPSQQHLFKFTLYCTKLQKAVIQMSKLKKFNEDVNQCFTVYMNFERNQLKFDKQKQTYKETHSYYQQESSLSSEKSISESSDYGENTNSSNNQLSQQQSTNGATRNQPLDLISNEEQVKKAKGIQFDQEQDFPDILQAVTSTKDNKPNKNTQQTPQKNILSNLNISQHNANDTTAITSSLDSPKNQQNGTNPQNNNNKNFLDNAPNLLSYNGNGLNTDQINVPQNYSFEFLDKENKKQNSLNNEKPSKQPKKDKQGIVENPEDLARLQTQNHITTNNNPSTNLDIISSSQKKNGEIQNNVQIKPNDDTKNKNDFNNNNNHNESEEQQQMSEESSQSNNKRETSLIMDILHKKPKSSKNQDISNMLSQMSFSSDKFDNFQRNTNQFENQEKQLFLLNCLFNKNSDDSSQNEEANTNEQSYNDIENVNVLQQLTMLEQKLNNLIENNSKKEKTLYEKEQYYLTL